MICLLIFAILAVFLCLYCYLETTRISVSSFTVTSKKIPSSLCIHKFLLLSDFHNTSFGKDNCRLISLINSCPADTLIISGDLINGSKKNELDYLERVLKGINDEKLIIYAPGNHEKKYFLRFPDEYARFMTLLSSYKVIYLSNSSFSPYEGVKLYGLDIPFEAYRDRKTFSELKLNDYLGFSDNMCYNLLIAHDPSYVANYSEWGADVVFSGHLHGGIIRLPILGGLISPRYKLFPKPDKGRYTYNKTEFIVSGGIGWHGIPFRFNNKPELVEVNFSNESAG